MIVAVQEKAWMDHKLMQVYLYEVWHPFIKRRAEELGLPAKSLLVMDSFSAHLTDDVTENFQKNNCTLAIIPGGCTSKVQPLDVSINKPCIQADSENQVVTLHEEQSRHLGLTSSYCQS